MEVVGLQKFPKYHGDWLHSSHPIGLHFLTFFSDLIASIGYVIDYINRIISGEIGYLMAGGGLGPRAGRSGVGARGVKGFF